MNSQVKTGLTHLGTFMGGLLAAVTFLASSQADLYAIWNQLNVVVVAITTLFAMAIPILTTAYGVYRTALGPRLTEIIADPKAVEVAREMPTSPAATAVGNALKKQP